MPERSQPVDCVHNPGINEQNVPATVLIIVGIATIFSLAQMTESSQNDCVQWNMEGVKGDAWYRTEEMNIRQSSQLLSEKREWGKKARKVKCRLKKLQGVTLIRRDDINLRLLNRSTITLAFYTRAGLNYSP